MYGMTTPDICVRFGQRLQRARKKKGMEQIDLAVAAKLTRNYISQIENGKQEACLRTIEKLATGLGVSLSQLFRGV